MMAECEGCGREVEAHTLEYLIHVEECACERKCPTEISPVALCGLCVREVQQEHALMPEAEVERLALIVERLTN